MLLSTKIKFCPTKIFFKFSKSLEKIKKIGSGVFLLSKTIFSSVKVASGRFLWSATTFSSGKVASGGFLLLKKELLKQCEEEGSLIVFSRGYEHTAGYLERRKGSVELKPILV